jgi:hypothetical protein
MPANWEEFHRGQWNVVEASMVGEPILKPWANPEGQMIQRLKRMRDEQGHCAKD